MPPATIESATMPMASVRVGWRMRSGAKSAVSPGSERRMVVASAAASPLRAASIAEHLLEVVHHLLDGGVAVARSPSRWRAPPRRRAPLRSPGAGAARPGSGSRTCFIATATWVSARNGASPDEHLVEHDPERVDVRLLGHVVAERLLGGHVVGGAEHAAGGRQALGLERARDAEVGDLGAPVAVDQDVLRLDVAVDELVLVRARQRPADLDGVGHRLGHRQPPIAPDAVLERLALHELEHDVGSAVVLPGVDHRDHVGVVQLGHGARLAPEALELVRVARDVPVHQLDGHPALERGVEGAVHARHAARPDLLVELVAIGYVRAGHRHLFSAFGCPCMPGTTPIRPARHLGRRSRGAAPCSLNSATTCHSPT